MLSFLLYGWSFVLITLPLVILKTLWIIPLGKKFFIGTPIVRFYWKTFLLDHLADFRGQAIEIDNNSTIDYFGRLNYSRNKVGLNAAHAIDISPEGKKEWTADITSCWNIPTSSYDLFLVQFTYHMIEKDKDALYHSIRIIKEGGILLCNFPGTGGYFPKGKTNNGYTSYIFRWYTPLGVELLLKEMGLAETDYEMVSNGNWLSRLQYLGFYIPKEVVPAFLLKKDDPTVPMLMSVRIKKPLGWRPIYEPRQLG